MTSTLFIIINMVESNDGYRPSVNRVEERSVWLANVKDDYLQLFARAPIIACHPDVGRFHVRLAGLDGYHRLALQLESERASCDIDRHREPVRVEQSLVARFEGRREDTDLLLLILRHSLDDLLLQQVRSCKVGVLSSRNTGKRNHPGQDET